MTNNDDQITPMLMISAYLINECGLDPDLVALCMETIEVPESAKGLWTAATRLNRHILPIMGSSDDPAIRQLVRRATPFCSAIENSFDRFPKLPDFRYEAARSTGRIRPGFLMGHPLFGVFWAGCDVARASTQYDCLRGHFAAGYLRVRPEVKEERSYILRNAGQYCRLIGSIADEAAPEDASGEAARSCIPHILRQLPKTWVGTSLYGGRLERLTHEAAGAGADKDEIRALYFLADIIRGRLPEKRDWEPRERKPGSGSEDRPVVVGKGEPLSLPRHTAPGEDIEVVDHVRCEGSEGQQTAWSGVDDEDMFPVDREVKVRPRKSVLNMNGDRLLHIRASNMADAVAAANQMFPFSRAQSTGDDITHLLTGLDRIERAVGDRVQVECMALAEVLLGTGQPLERCHAARWMNAGPEDGLWLDPNRGVFGFPPWTPQGHDRPTEPLVLPMPDRMKKALAVLVQVSGIQPGGRLFSTGLKVLKKRLRGALKAISEGSGATLSLAAIGADLYRTLAQHHGGNQSPPILLTGQATHRGYLPATYTEASAESLLRTYVRAEEALHNATFAPASLANAMNACVKTCGSAFVPRMANIQRCVASLRDHVRATAYVPPRRAGIIETHFSYAVYVHGMLSFATGWRPSVLPLPDVRLIDRTTGMCLLSDKDDDDAYHTHLIWLPEVVVEQLCLWEDHLRLVAERLIIINRDSASALRWADPIRLTGKRRKDKKSWRDDPRFLFGLQMDGTRRPLLPEQIEASFQEFFGKKDNGHRHFVRTELIRRGVPDEVVRALLGHWRNGEESFGKYSAMDPWAYRTALARVLPGMLDEMGWSAMESPFWKQ